VKGSIFIGVSLDGQIARADGGLDWLPHGNGEDYGYDAFMATVDALVMGRGTYDIVRKFDKWFYGTKPVFVLSHRELEPPHDGAVVERLTGTPAEVAAEMDRRGVKHVYVDGGITIQQFLDAGLIQRLIISRVPVLIGKGIPLFGATSKDIPLKLISTRSWPSGMVQCEYEVL